MAAHKRVIRRRLYLRVCWKCDINVSQLEKSTLSLHIRTSACGCAKRLEQSSDFYGMICEPCMVLFSGLRHIPLPKKPSSLLPSSTSTFAINLQTRCQSTRSYLTCSTLRQPQPTNDVSLRHDPLCYRIRSWYSRSRPSLRIRTLWQTR